MATPTLPLKRLLAAGAKKSAQIWGTAEAMGAGNGLLLESDGGLSRTQPYLPALEADTPFVMEGDLGPIDPVDFAPAFTMRYDPGQLGALIAQLFGNAGASSPVGAGFAHVFDWDDENYGEFCTFAVERPSKIFEVASAKPYALDFNIADGFLKGSISLRGDALINTSAVNTLTQIDALTYADRGNRVKFSDLTVYMLSQASVSEPDSSTKLELSDITLHFERPHDSPHAAGGASIIEPAENGHSIITVELTFPRMNTVNNLYFADFIAETEKKMYIWFYGEYISGGAGQQYQVMFYYPRLRIIEIDYPFDDIVPGRIKFQAEKTSSLAAGFGHHTPYLRIANTQEGDYFAL